MIGIDTNVLLRIFGSDEDDPDQVAAARGLLRTAAPLFVNPIVLAEFVWTLRRTYKLDRRAIHARLAAIAGAPEFTYAFPQATRRAVELFREGPADFADYLIGEIDRDLGCTTTMTFDRQAALAATFTSVGG